MGNVQWAYRISALGYLFLALSASYGLAQPVLDFRPIPPGPGSRTTAGIVNGNRIEILPGNIVQLDMFISDWANVFPGALDVIDVGIDGNSYCTGSGAPLNPLGFPSTPITSCSTVNSCLEGGTCYDGAYISKNKCTVDSMIDPTGAHCLGPADCPGEFCAMNPDFISPTFDLITVAVFSQGLSYRYALASRFGDFNDPGVEKYIATLLVEIPATARGLYVFSFDQIGITTSWSNFFKGPHDAPFGTIISAEILVVEGNNDADGDGVIDSEDLCPGADDTVFGDCQSAIPTVSAWGLVILSLLLMVGGKVMYNRKPSELFIP